MRNGFEAGQSRRAILQAAFNRRCLNHVARRRARSWRQPPDRCNNAASAPKLTCPIIIRFSHEPDYQHSGRLLPRAWYMKILRKSAVQDGRDNEAHAEFSGGTTLRGSADHALVSWFGNS